MAGLERIQRCRTEVYNYKNSYWRARNADGDLELTRTEVEHRRDTPSASTKFTSEISKAKGRK